MSKPEYLVSYFPYTEIVSRYYKVGELIFTLFYPTDTTLNTLRY